MTTHQPSQPLISTEHLGIHYGNRSAIADVSVIFDRGEMVAVLGPNGAGKSTLLKALAGLLPPSHGRMTFAGRPLRGPLAQVTYIPQRASADWTFPVSVRDAVLMGLARSAPRWRPFTRHEKRQAHDALETVGMHQLADVQIGTLSGGQQQRVFLARALVSCGDALLLDEPFTGVDVPTQELLIDLFANLRSQKRAIIYATHDLSQAATASDRIVLINGTVIADGAPEAVMTEGPLRQTFGGQVVVVPASRAGAPEEALAGVGR